MDNKGASFTFQLIVNTREDEEDKFAMNGILETSAGKSHLSIALTDEESAKVREIAAKVWQRYRQVLKAEL